MTFNLATILRESARHSPEKPMVYFADRTITYREVEEITDRVATGLRAAGATPGERVAVQLANQPEFIYAYFGILKAGLVMVPLNPLLKTPEIRYQLHDSGASMLITMDEVLAEALPAARTGAPIPVYAAGGDATHDTVSDVRDFTELLANHPETHTHATDPMDTAVLLYTSGTTGQPKGAELTHFQLYMNCTASGALIGYEPDDVGLAVLPLFHIFGLSSVLNTAVRYGTALALVPRFEVKDVVEVIAARGVTILPGVPTMFAGLLYGDIDARDLDTVRVGVSGGSAMPAELLDAVETAFAPITILEGYGLSECASVATFNVSAHERKSLSVGKPIWGVEMRVVGDDGRTLPAGPEHIGELQMCGHNVMKGYFNRPDETAETLRDGWLATGDLGYRDDDGFYFIVDRKKDLVVRGGYNVYPREIEEVLYQHPAVAEAAVIGIPDERLGEEIRAVVSLKRGERVTEEDIIAFAKKRLAAYKYPRTVHIVADLPKGSTGKILKKELRATSTHLATNGDH